MGARGGKKAGAPRQSNLRVSFWRTIGYAEMMKPPTFTHPIDDPKAGVRYVVMAYRELSSAEVVQMVRVYWQGCKKSKRPKRGTTVTLMTVIGA
jgi:hypothetical protein